MKQQNDANLQQLNQQTDSTDVKQALSGSDNKRKLDWGQYGDHGTQKPLTWLFNICVTGLSIMQSE